VVGPLAGLGWGLLVAGLWAAGLWPPAPAESHPIYIGRITAALGSSAQVSSAQASSDQASSGRDSSARRNPARGDSALSGRLYANRLDFLEVLAARHTRPLYELSRDQLDSLSAAYLAHHLIAVADADTLPLSIGGSGQEREDVWFDFSFPWPEGARQLRLGATVLFEQREQRNLLVLSTPAAVLRHVFTHTQPVFAVECGPP